ncbi:hypothetical protein Sjap_012046 [Stephania japonica]|uniref:Ubiquitin-like domain-containing protein n=1 Tax=Stephania japonica TaxID=461633 RepID=A0AAP0P642_9MAGN
MEIQVTNLKGRRITIELEAPDTLDYLKHKILDKEGVPLDKQRLVYGGVQLDDENVIASPKNPAFNGVDAIKRKQVASETRIHDLSTLSYVEVEGLLDSLMKNLQKGTVDEDDAYLSIGNESISNLCPKEEY